MVIATIMAITITTIITIITTMPMAEPPALYDLMSWMSPAWPIGGFAHSGGLEWAVEEGLVTDRGSTLRWIIDLIDHGSIHNDVVLFVHAWRAARAGDGEQLAGIAELGAASQTGYERRLEAIAQGAAFRRIALSTAGESAFAPLLAEVEDDNLTYAVAAAVLFAAHGIGLEAALTAWLHGVVANIVSAAQRLVPLGQTDGQHVLRDARPAVFAAMARATDLPEDGDPFDAMGGCTLVADIGCMAHETQYTRLFRT
ncbi:MAG: urease accessory protein UreF [Sphingobium sp.]